ncbi:MAG TPA: hypothetical protein VFI00_14750, partial [Kribbella sp.]|nr:hypothetical protein [Kribbella sp.]
MDEGGSGHGEGGLRHPLLVALIAALASALIGAGATVWAARQGKLDAIAPPTTITSTVPGPTTTATATVTVTPSSSTAGAGATLGTGTDTAGDSLAELEPIAGSFVKGSFAIHAQPFGDGLYRSVGTCNR